MIHIGLFEGIGGFSLAAEWCGWKTLATCEINQFGQKILNHYWPHAYHHGDIHTLTYETINLELSKRFGTHWRNDDIIVTGGFPCQPFSLAGKRKGTSDDRHLWPEMLRTIREIQPRWVVGENVFGIVNWDAGVVFEQVQTDLENEGYEVQPYVLPACSVNAPHKRERVWFVAHRADGRCEHGQIYGCGSKEKTRSGKISNIIGGTGESWITSDTNSERQQTGVELQVTGNEKQPAGINTEGTFTNSEGKRHEPLDENRTSQLSTQTEKKIHGGDSDKHDGNMDASDTDSEGLERCENGGIINCCGEKSHKQPAGCVQPNWENFPTQSPICDGNDGISARLDSITFSKWRNESIKAGGNAIVPQVAYQIFKTIQKYEDETQHI